MKKISIAAACLTAFAAASAHAQSSVTLYGLVDAGIAYTNNVGGSGRVALASGNISGSRFGLKGAEDLGGGLKAIFLLENGFSVNNGQLGQNSRMFGRQAYVGLSSNAFGTLTLGRQYDDVVDFVSPLSATAGTFGDSGFAHPYDNDNLQHSVRFNNSVKYTSLNYDGFKFGGMYAFSNSTGFAVSRAYSAAASYTYGPLTAAAGYLQTNGSGSKTGTTFTNTAGAVDQAEVKGNLTSDVQRTAAAGVNYAFGPAVVGFVYSHSQYQGTSAFGLSSGSVRFDNYEVNGMYNITPALKAGVSYTYTDGHLNGATSYGADPKWNQVNAITRYSLSKRTEIYAEAMYQHATGNKNVANMYNSGGASSTGNQVMGAVGMLTRF
ncbi:putative porin [Paraburkholderia bannensis]|uniref:Putative porin n=1 Tax=Paraburkholderia bannensis TaxID=765414 RepID=A0A7W9U2Z8_9BURK|nr:MULTISPECIES: porin [Paraburkholderia]MBB3261045.1 putative porin [Paraburkholderia sp. WP4_3_2]MBB6106082.1 putative porin [Paraburkholderia bannensis]